MAPYHPPTSGRVGAMRLDFNENTVGCSPKALERLKQALTGELLATYPEYEAVREKAAAFFGVGADQMTFCDGTDEGIHILIQTYVEAGDEVVMTWPAYPMLRFYAQVAGAEPVLVPYCEPDLAFPLDELLAAIGPKTRAVLVANPNNPTGGAIGLADIERILEKAAGAAVLIDEAYFEFYGVTALDLLPRYPNLFVSRTFSKTYGLAGLRVGCLFSQAENMALVRKGQSPYSVNVLAAACVTAAIEDQEYVRGYVREVLEAREELLAALRRLDIPYWPTEANFVLVHLGDKASRVVEGLAARGIRVRDRGKERVGAVRFTVGTREQTAQLIAAVEELL
ncbi:MAG: aminotransferase class I/II-fold pyridoxal phosphate-dependent enzyme [Acidobacteria bacterium]|nr:aminotransferase class I/II-fold pyridoxal phosphate-dependent enzyme [Acidobacteriota bacterium]